MKLFCYLYVFDINNIFEIEKQYKTKKFRKIQRAKKTKFKKKIKKQQIKFKKMIFVLFNVMSNFEQDLSISASFNPYFE